MTLFIFYVFSLVAIVLEVHGISVTVPVGTLNGKVVVTRENFTYYSFQKVPFAEPPVGNLRFQAPLPKHNSTDNFTNTKVDYRCYQIKSEENVSFFGAEQTEDCLYLNIYTPQLPAETYNTLLPVLVFYHGGGFIYGYTGEKVLGPDFFIQEDILVVTVNYRLGPFGFISTGDTVIPGNAGLKDQVLGLKWVKDNIHYFGGDPSKITIGGESAGAASAVLLMLNEEAKGLIRGVIAQSGSALHNWSYQRNPRRIAFELAQNIDKNFTSNSTEDLRDFLLQAEPEQIIEAGYTIVSVIGVCLFEEFISFAPAVEVEHEGAFLTDANRYELMESGNVAKVPILIGFTSEEALFVADLISEGFQANHFQDLDEHLEKLTLLEMELNKSDLNASKEVGKRIRNIYADGDLSGNIAQGIRLCSDLLFTNGVIKTAELLSKWSDVFLYQFSHSGNITQFTAEILQTGFEKVTHFSDHFYLWRDIQEHDTADYSTMSEGDIKTHERMVKMWSNFIKYLNPTPRMEENTQVLWPSARSRGNETLLYMNINTTLEVRENPREDTYRLWNTVYEEYAEKPYSTF